MNFSISPKTTAYNWRFKNNFPVSGFMQKGEK